MCTVRWFYPSPAGEGENLEVSECMLPSFAPYLSKIPKTLTFSLSCASYTTSLVSVFIPSLTSLGWGASQPGGKRLRQPLPRQAADSYDDTGRYFLNSPTLMCGTIIWNKIKKETLTKNEWGVKSDHSGGSRMVSWHGARRQMCPGFLSRVLGTTSDFGL